jgi:hypothetical protein
MVRSFESRLVELMIPAVTVCSKPKGHQSREPNRRPASSRSRRCGLAWSLRGEFDFNNGEIGFSVAHRRAVREDRCAIVKLLPGFDLRLQ